MPGTASRNRMAAACVLLALAALAFVAAPAYGAVGVSPSKIELQMEPSATETFTVTVTSDGDSEMTVRVRAWDFARDESGAVHPLGPEDAGTFRGGSAWVVLPVPTEQTMAAGGKVTFDFAVKTPADATDGTHYCYVTFDSTPAVNEPIVDEGTGVVTAPVTYSMSAMLLVTIGDPTGTPAYREGVSVRRLDVKRLNLKPEIVLSTALRNDGNVHMNLAQGSGILILQGDTIKGELPFQEYTLLPEATIVIPAAWRSNALVGMYTARFLGDVGLDEPLVAERRFLVIKPWFIAACAAALVFLIVVFRLFFRRFRIQLAPRTDDIGPVAPTATQAVTGPPSGSAAPPTAQAGASPVPQARSHTRHARGKHRKH